MKNINMLLGLPFNRDTEKLKNWRKIISNLPSVNKLLPWRCIGINIVSNLLTDLCIVIGKAVFASE